MFLFKNLFLFSVDAALLCLLGTGQRSSITKENQLWEYRNYQDEVFGIDHRGSVSQIRKLHFNSDFQEWPRGFLG